MSSQQQHSLDPTDDLNQILRDFERENAHIFAPPIETPPMPNYDNDFLFNEFLTPNVNAEGNNQYGIGIPSLPQPTPPAPPPSLAVPSPLAAGPPAPPMVAQQIFSNAVNQPPMLVIIEQPIERCRFRYKAEQGPHGALRGVSGKRQKSSPKVKIENVRGKGYVIASLWTNEDIPRPHINELWGTDCENGCCRITLDSNMIASFPNLGIMRQKEKEVGDILYEKYLKEYEMNGWTVTDDIKESLREKSQKEMATMKDCLHCVRVGFQAHISDSNNKEFVTPIVLSSPVFNSQNPGFSELRIAELDKSYGSCLGGDTVWMRCAAKIRRDQIKIKFHEATSGWEVEATFSPNEVYEQILVIFKTPPYRDTNISERAHVSIHLYRTTDGEYSAPVDFVYLPVDDGPIAKRPRKMIPAFGPDGFGYASYNHMAAHTPSSSSPAYDTSCSPQGHSPQHQWSSGYMSQSTTGSHQFRKRHLPTSASRSRPPPSFDSGIDVNSTSGPQSATSVADEPLRSRIEQLTLAEVGKLSDAPKVQKYLCTLWETHVKALWDFGTEGDPEPLVGACKHLIGLQDEHGNTALHLSVRSKQPFALKTMLKVLDGVPNKAEIINLQNYRKQTPLHLAVRYGDGDCVHYLMKSGADRNVLDCDGMNVIHYLSDTFNEAIYRDVLFPPNESTSVPVDLDLLNNEGVNVVHLAVKRKKLALLESLIEATASLTVVERNTGKSPMHLAAEGGDVDIVEVLLQNKVEIDTQMYDGTTPLQLAVKSKQEAVIARLVAAGADVNVKTSHKSEEPSEEGTDEEIIGGESGPELQSAMGLAEGDENIIALLQGKPYVMPHTETASSSLAADQDHDGPGPSTGARPKNVQPAKLAPAPGLHSSVSGESMPETVPASLRDDLSSLDFVTRLRLGKLLDKDSLWEQLAAALNCEHMIEFIKVCTEAENSSPTVLLLDQYEQMVHPTITRLLNALEEVGHQSAIELIVTSQNQQRQQMERVAAQPNEDVSMD